MVDYILTKMLEINVNNRIPMKTSLYFIDFQLILKKNLVICNNSNFAFNSVYSKNIDFLKHGRLNSHQNPENQGRKRNSNENKLIFH